MIALICLSVLYSTVNGLAIPYRNKFGGNNGADPRWADPNSLGGNWNEPGGWNEPVGAPEWIEQGPWPEQQGPNAQWNEPGGWNEQGAGGFDPAVGGGWNDPNAVLDPGMPAGNIPLSPAGGANPGGGGNSGNSVDIGTVITALVEAVINTKKPAPIGADAAGDFPMGGGVGPGGAPGGAPGGGDPGWQDPGTMAGGDVNWGAALGIGRPRGPDMGVDGPRPEMGIGGPLGPEMAGPGGDWLNGPVDPFEGGASPNDIYPPGKYSRGYEPSYGYKKPYAKPKPYGQKSPQKYGKSYGKPQYGTYGKKPTKTYAKPQYVKPKVYKTYKKVYSKPRKGGY